MKIIGHANMPSRVAADASRLFAKNLLNFLKPLIDTERGVFNIDMEDETVSGTLVTRDGKIVHPMLTGAHSSLAAEGPNAIETTDELKPESAAAAD